MILTGDLGFNNQASEVEPYLIRWASFMRQMASILSGEIMIIVNMAIIILLAL